MPTAIEAIFGANSAPFGAELEKVQVIASAASRKLALADIKANEQSLARLKANDDLKLAETARFFEEQAAMYEEAAAAQTLTAQSMATGGLQLPGIAGAAEKDAAGAAKLAKETEGAAKEMHGGSTIIRETFVLFREGMRGNFTRMLGSFTILIGAIGSAAAVIAAGVAAIVAVPAWRTWKAIKAEKSGAKDFEEMSKNESGDLQNRIDLMKSAGLIDAKTAQEYGDRLKRGDVEGVLGATNKLMPKGGIDALSKMSNVSKAIEDFQNQQAEINHKEATTPSEKYKADTMSLMQVQAQLNQLNQGSSEWLEKRKEWNTLYLQQIQDINDQKKQTAEDKKKADKEKQEKERERREKEERDRNQLLQEDAARTRGYGLSNNQRIGAYAATPPDWAVLISSSKETAQNTRSLRGENRGTVRNTPLRTSPRGAFG
jgi:hypothetical protein